MSVHALKFFPSKQADPRSGQVMVLTVLTLGGALLRLEIDVPDDVKVFLERKATA